MWFKVKSENNTEVGELLIYYYSKVALLAFIPFWLTLKNEKNPSLFEITLNFEIIGNKE